MNPKYRPPQRPWTDQEFMTVRRLSRQGMGLEEVRQKTNELFSLTLSETAFRSRCDARGLKFSRPLAHHGTSRLSHGAPSPSPQQGARND
jgi:hypothetical protein